MGGGTLLYIKGVGFNTAPHGNKVYLGDKECHVTGSSEVYIQCFTIAHPKNEAVPLTLYVDGKAAVCSTYNCMVSYSNHYTPRLDHVLPTSSTPDQLVSFQGMLHISTTSDIEFIKVGQFHCNTQNQPTAKKSYWSSSSQVKCVISPQSTAGYFRTQFKGPNGDLEKAYSATSYDLNSHPYQFKVVPVIQKVSSNLGSILGQVLEIEGRGFSEFKDQMVITAGRHACEIMSQSKTKITCKVQPNYKNPSPVATDSTVGTAGFTFKHYDLTSDNIENNIADIRGNQTTVTLNKTETRYDVDVPDFYHKRKTMVHFKGYFRANLTGKHIFKMVSRPETAQVYLSNVTDSALDSDLQKIMNMSSYSRNTYYRNFNYKSMAVGSKGRSDAVDLTAGKFYLMEGFYMNYHWDHGHFSLAVETPSFNNTVRNNTIAKAANLTLQYPHDQEKMYIRLMNVASGTFSLKMNSRDSQDIAFNAAASTLKWNLDHKLAAYGDAQVTKVNLDSAGEATNSTDAADIFGYQYDITFAKNRGDNVDKKPFLIVSKLKALTGKSLQVTIAITQKPGPVLGGDYRMTLGDKFEIVKATDSAETVRLALTRLGYDGSIKVVQHGHDIENHHYMVYFNGQKGSPTLPTLDKTNLTCTNMDCLSVSMHDFKDNRGDLTANSLEFIPLSSEFGRKAVSKPQIKVTVKDVLSGCGKGANCDYETDSAKTPKVSAVSISGAQMTITIAQATPAVTVDKTLLSITYADQKCSLSSWTGTSIVCSLAQNADNSNKIVAGDQLPQVHYKGLGYFEYASALSATAVSPTVASLSVQTGSTGGGQALDIVGTNFPFLAGSNATQSLSVTVGGTAAKVTAYENQKISIVTPPKGSSATTCDLVVSVQGKTATIQYSYASTSAPIITAIDITSASPALKTTVTLTGTNFDTDKAQLTADLINSDPNKESYPVSIFSCTSTSIVLVMSGGKQGTYSLMVYKKGYGSYAYNVNSNTSPIQFEYKFVMTSISPLKGSTEGGTVLTIGGINFATKTNQMQVFLGPQNVICDVLTTTATELTCRTRKASYDAKVTVTLTQRLQDVATCSDSNSANACGFLYDTASTPVINAFPAVTNIKNDETITLNGTGLTAASGSPVLRLSSSSVNLDKDSATASDTQLTFKMPSLGQGLMSANVYIPNKGYAKFDGLTNLPLLNNLLDITSISPSSGSYGGNLLTILGSGFDALTEIVLHKTWDNKCEIRSRTASQITCKFNIMNGNDGEKQAVKMKQNGETKEPSSTLEYTNDVSKTVVVKDVGGETQNPTEVSVPDNGQVDLVINGYANMDDAMTITLWSPANRKAFSGVIQGTPSATSLTVRFSALPLDDYLLEMLVNNKGYAYLPQQTNQIKVKAMATAPTCLTSNKVTSLVGGEVLVSGVGFDTAVLGNNQVRICGYPCQVTAATATQLTCSHEGVINQAVDDAFRHEEPKEIKPVAVQTNLDSNVGRLTDGLFDDYYEGKDNNVVFDFGENMQANLSEIKIFPSVKDDIKKLNGTLIEGSNDNSTYTTIMNMERSSIKPGWNDWISGNYADNKVFRFVRINFNKEKVENRRISEVRFVGLVQYAKTSGKTSISCDSAVKVNGMAQAVQADAIEMREDKTPSVTSLSPTSGTTLGNFDITFVGTGFGTVQNDVKVTIDSVACVVKSVSDTQVVCTAGARPTYTLPRVKVMVQHRMAANQGNTFMYIEKWSESATWGGESPPREGDSVFIPKGQNVLLDVSPPRLNALMIEGQLVFEDKDLTLQAEYIIANGGNVTIGTLTNRIQSNINIILHGVRDGKQLPMFGNKAFVMNKGVLDIHGKVRSKTWTTLSETAAAGADTIKLDEAVDWQVGELVGIATSTYSYNHSESRAIAERIDDKTFRLNETLQFKHYSAVETHNGKNVPLKCEVGLLSRNVKIMGAPGSWESGYGGHLMIHGKQIEGTVARITYAEFTHMGQQSILARYTMHFHYCGNMFKSLIEGNAVHHALARIVTIHGTNFLRVRKNVGYFVYGHNYFLEDGIESNNMLEGNLAMKTVELHSLLVSDQSAASYWITRPNNYIKSNHAAGGDWYGYWYEIHNHPKESNMNPDVCPQGERVLEFKDNVAHGYKRYGLRINALQSREKPCSTGRVDFRNGVPGESTDVNKPILSVFENFLAFNCRDNGVQAEKMGHTLFKNMQLLENRLGGIIVHTTNFTSKAFPVILEDILVVGHSTDNDHGKDEVHPDEKQSGVILPTTEEIRVKNIQFVNFEKNFTNCFQTCAMCQNGDFLTTGGTHYELEGITFVGSVHQKIFFMGQANDIIHDVDGSVSGKNAESYITPSQPHLKDEANCELKQNEYSVDSLVCNNQVQIRRVQFFSLTPSSAFHSSPFKIALIDPADNKNISSVNSTKVTQQYFDKAVMNDVIPSWTVPVITGRMYHIMWGNGLDFESLAVMPKYNWKSTDKGVMFRLNNTKTRELFESRIYYGKNVVASFESNRSVVGLSNERTAKPEASGILVNDHGVLSPEHNNKWELNGLAHSGVAAPQKETIDFSKLQLGQLDYDNDTKRINFFISGSMNCTSLSLSPVACRTNCPDPTKDCAVDKVERKWSDVKNWKSGVLPAEGEDVVVECPWTMVLDVADTPVFNSLSIVGTLKFDESIAHTTLKSKSIYVKGGQLLAGTPEKAFSKKITIEIHGEATSPDTLVDDYVVGSNKNLIVTGRLALYGPVPTIAKTRLEVYADKGATELTVTDSTGWKAGDTLVVTASAENYFEDEYKVIASVAGKVITLTEGLAHDHYGNATRMMSINGEVDMRASVGLISRDIQVHTKGDFRGSTVIIAGSRLKDPATNLMKQKIGAVNVTGVQFIKGGQVDGNLAAINFQYTDLNASIPSSLIEGCSFSETRGQCIYIGNSKNISVLNNVITQCEKYGVALFDKTNHIKVEDNLLAGIRMKASVKAGKAYEYTAAISTEKAQPGMVVSVRNNVAQGVEGIAYLITGVNCDDRLNQYFVNNTAGSAEGGMVPINNGTGCYHYGNLFAYRCNVGVISQFAADSIHTENITLAENKLNAKMQFAHATVYDVSQRYDNIHILAVARPDCPKCYASSNWCSWNTGSTPSIHQLAGQHIEEIASVRGVQKICTNSVKDTRTFITNMVYENFKQSYSEPAWAKCKGNLMIHLEQIAHDTASQYYMWNSRKVNCDIESVIKYDNSDPATAGWTGGCGAVGPCTGTETFQITDFDGGILGKPGQTLHAKRPALADGLDCRKYDKWNGYHCMGLNYRVLLFENEGKDYYTTMYQPEIQTKMMSKKYAINMFKEWVWEGLMPMDKRKAIFIAVVQKTLRHNMTFNSGVPSSASFRLQHFPQQGKELDYIIMYMKFDDPVSIQLKVNGTLKNPNLPSANVKLEDKTTECGAHNYNEDTRELEFVLTQECVVYYEKLTTLKVTMHLSVNINDFYKNDGLTTFVDKMCAFLGIPTNRLRIANVRAGSVYIDFNVVSENTGNSADPNAEASKLAIMKDKMIKAHEAGGLDVGFPVKAITAKVQKSETPPTPTSNDAPPEEKNNTALVVAIVIPVIFILFIGIIMSKMLIHKKEVKNMSKVQPQHVETNQLVEIDYAKIQMEQQQLPIYSGPQAINNLPPVMARPSIYVQTIEEDIVDEPLPNNMFDRPTARQ